MPGAFAQELPESVKINWLGQMGIKSSLLGPPSIRLLPPTCQRHEHDVLAALQRPDATSHFVSVHLWHANIQQRNFRSKAFDNAQGGLTVGGPEYLMPI